MAEKEINEESFSFGEYVRNLRKSKNISLTEAAKRMGIAVQKLSDIESGRRYKRNIYLDFIQKVSEVYNVPLSEIAKKVDKTIKNERSVRDILNELAPAARLSELLCKRIVDEAPKYSTDLEELALELSKYIDDMKILISLLNKRQVTINNSEEKEP